MSDLIGLFPIGNAADMPQRWPDDRFDVIWVLVRDASAQDYRFVSLTQELLAGDATARITSPQSS